MDVLRQTLDAIKLYLTFTVFIIVEWGLRLRLNKISFVTQSSTFQLMFSIEGVCFKFMVESSV